MARLRLWPFKKKQQPPSPEPTGNVLQGPRGSGVTFTHSLTHEPKDDTLSISSKPDDTRSGHDSRSHLEQKKNRESLFSTPVSNKLSGEQRTLSPISLEAPRTELPRGETHLSISSAEKRHSERPRTPLNEESTLGLDFFSEALRMRVQRHPSANRSGNASSSSQASKSGDISLATSKPGSLSSDTKRKMYLPPSPDDSLIIFSREALLEHDSMNIPAPTVQTELGSTSKALTRNDRAPNSVANFAEMESLYMEGLRLRRAIETEKANLTVFNNSVHRIQEVSATVTEELKTELNSWNELTDAFQQDQTRLNQLLAEERQRDTQQRQVLEAHHEEVENSKLRIIKAFHQQHVAVTHQVTDNLKEAAEHVTQTVSRMETLFGMTEKEREERLRRAQLRKVNLSHLTQLLEDTRERLFNVA